MDTEKSLTDEVWRLCLNEICCASPLWYEIMQEAFPEKKEGKAFGTNGRTLFYEPQAFLQGFVKKGKTGVCRLLLHTLFHLLYTHAKSESPNLLWDLACDMLAEYTIDCMHLKSAGYLQEEAAALCQEIWQEKASLSTQEVYEQLLQRHPDRETLQAWTLWFQADDHKLWGGGDGKDLALLLEKIQRFSPSNGPQGLFGQGGRGAGSEKESEWFLVQKQRRQKFHSFLRRFTSLREEQQMDVNSFDYIPYLYGLSHYGNLPLWEPLEYTETKRLEELVIAFDTSSSCKRETVQRFLEEIYAVLGRQEDFFRKFQVHIIQCDCYVQEDKLVTCEREWKAYLKKIKIQGRGGTDFRPVFRYVEALKKDKQLQRLKGLLYFTDGDGIFPREKPDYEVVFLLTKEPPKETKIPAWAEILYMEENL